MTDSAPPVLQVSQLSKSFTVHNRGATIAAVAAVDLQAAAGSINALTGPSGAGKSTILKCIYRRYLPSGGAIYLQAEGERIDLASAEDSTVLRLRQRQLGFITQFLHCLPRRSALEVVAGPMLATGADSQLAEARAAELLRRLHLPEALWRLPPATFSGGEQQRVNIARGLIRPAALLLVDEPTASLDAASAERVMQLLLEARQAGTAILGIWHDPKIIETYADQAIAIVPPLAEVA